MPFRRVGNFFILHFLLHFLFFFQVYSPWKTGHDLVRAAKGDSFLFHGLIIQPDADKVVYLFFSGFLDGDDFSFLRNGAFSFCRIVLYNPRSEVHLTFRYHIALF